MKITSLHNGDSNLNSLIGCISLICPISNFKIFLQSPLAYLPVFFRFKPWQHIPYTHILSLLVTSLPHSNRRPTSWMVPQIPEIVVNLLEWRFCNFPCHCTKLVSSWYSQCKCLLYLYISLICVCVHFKVLPLLHQQRQGLLQYSGKICAIIKTLLCVSVCAYQKLLLNPFPHFSPL